jgi:hypothetical protein
MITSRDDTGTIAADGFWHARKLKSRSRARYQSPSYNRNDILSLP